jgi:Lipocalin-like domain
MAVITAEGRKAAQTDEDRAALLRNMIAYTGIYKLEGDRWTTKVDVSWNESWVGTDQVRILRFEGDKLVGEGLPAPGANQQVVKGVATWTKSK